MQIYRMKITNTCANTWTEMYRYLCKLIDRYLQIHVQIHGYKCTNTCANTWTKMWKKHGLKCTNAYANTWTEIYNYNHTVICKYRNVQKFDSWRECLTVGAFPNISPTLPIALCGKHINPFSCCETWTLLAHHQHFISFFKKRKYTWVILCEMGQFWTVRLENQFFGPKQANYTPWGASGPNLAFPSHLGGHFCPQVGLGVSEEPKISNKLLV